ncbi:hypothetical protein IAI10_06665 [Clostridium sp. 19966]|uniref:hypothetical protein n=1 Tax=Clostridium sp. 19966 TaxID=2768166 RepID=UPI0028DD542F|nr:hypothetical protein [Clostridium sp. 19966]MDT8716334.1 hypothetical protein [Clostridium sp. 19966]
MYFKEIISQKIYNIIDMNVEDVIEETENPIFGDYTLPCHLIAKKINQAPNLLAEKIKANLKAVELERVECVGSHINIYIKKDILAEYTLNKLARYKDYKPLKTGKKILINSSLNFYKKSNFINNKLNLVISEAIYRTMNFSGYECEQLFSVYDYEINSYYEDFLFNKKYKCTYLNAHNKELISIINELKIKCRQIEVKKGTALIIPLEEYNLSPIVLCINDKLIFNKSVDYLQIKYIEKLYNDYKLINIVPRKNSDHLKKLEACLYNKNTNIKLNSLLIGKFKFKAQGSKDNGNDFFVILKSKIRIKYIDVSINDIDTICKNSFIFNCLYFLNDRFIYFDIDYMTDYNNKNYIFIQKIYTYLKNKIDRIDNKCELSLIQEERYYNIIKHIYKFHTVIQKSAENINPFFIVDFAIKLAEKLYIICKDDYSNEVIKLISTSLIILDTSMKLIGINLL